MASAASDTTGWQKWETVKTPQGEVLYKDPNKPGWVLDPVLTANRGRNVFRRDPTLEITKTQEAEDAQKRQQDLQEQAASPIGQLTPVIGATAGTVGGAYLINSLGKTPATPPPVPGVPQVPPPVSTVPTPPVASVPGGAPPAAPNVVGATEVSSATPAPVGELGSLGSQAGVVFQGIRLGQQGAAAYERGRGQGAVQGAKEGVKGDGGFMDTIQSFDPFALQARLLGGALGGIFGSPTTTETINKRWSKLADQGAVTPEQLAAKQADLQRSAKERSQDPLTGKKWDLQTAQDRVKAGGTAADEFGLVYGNFKTFGKDWDAYTPDQKRAIITANAQAGNYTSDKGDVLFKDEEKAKQIKDQVLSSVTAPVASNAPTSVQQMMRTNTRSPGIDKNGKRISY